MENASYAAFIITAHYELIDNKPVIHLYGRLETGESFEATIQREPYFFIQKSNEELLQSFAPQAKRKDVKLQTMQGQTVTKVILENPKDVASLRKTLEDNNVPCFEADIRFTRRFFIDNDILSLVTISGPSTKGEHSDLFFQEPKITPLESAKEIVDKVKPTMLSFDIETDANAGQVYSISLYDNKHQEVLVVKNDALQEIKEKGEIDHTTLFENEKDLLAAFVRRVQEIDPDILVGWNVIDFDLKVLSLRAKQFKVPLTLGRSDKPLSLRIESSFFRDSSVNVQGRIVLDGIQLLRSSFVKLDDYKLNTAAKHFLKDTKLIQDDDRFDIIDKLYTQDPKHFVEYNLKDSQLVYDILIVSGVYDLTMQRSLLSGLHMDEVKASIASFDSLYLRSLRHEGFVAPSTRPNDSTEGLGGYVMSPKPGIYNNVLVLDFKSLYPSLMRTFNIDPISYLGSVDEFKKKKKNYDDKDKFIVAPNGAIFANRDGILPKILTRLWTARDQARKEGNELARYAIKILMNSMYGVLASQNSRFHIRNLSNAITYFGQHFIKLTESQVKEMGYEVIYGDTDSVFVDVKTKDSKVAQNTGKEIEKKLNAFMEHHIKEEYHRDSVLELEFEKLFVKFFMPKVRGSEQGAKKRYAGLKIRDLNADKQETVLDFTGLEFVRRDWTELAKEFQMKLLNLIFADKDDEVDKFVIQFVKDVKAGKHDDLLVYRKALRKDLSSYTKTTPPHVKAARLLDEVKSNIIEYVMTSEGPQPVEKVTAPLDYEHYLEKQIKPLADSVLGLKGESFEDILKGHSQSGLDQFF